MDLKTQKSILFQCFLYGLLLYNFSACSSDLSIPEHPDFNYHIRPILSNNCYTCHGPDPSSREAGLRLDNFEGATTVLESGKQAIVPGDPKASELIKRITTSDHEDQMPPPEAKKQLTNREIKLLEKWIEQGAEWKEHWAFIPPKMPQELESQSIQKNIDQLINQKLLEENLAPAPRANRNALIRRLYYSLTGLPPAPEQVKQFIQDETPNAYERLVNEVLDSPHFGEHWTRHWMDLVRYAESRGHEYDFTIGGAWQYRDYLIRAFNEDLPYDQLIREHLAGDLTTPRLHPTEHFNEAPLGTAFYAFGEGKHGPVDLKVDEAERIDNIIDVTTKTFQAMTVACARCHDHKFDPLPTTDYYSMYGILESARFTPIAARTTTQVLEARDSIHLVEAAIRRIIARENGINSDAPKTVKTNFQNKPKTDGVKNHLNLKRKHKEGITILGDFRNGTLNGWYSDGLAFDGRNAMGKPVFDAQNRLKKLETGKASSKILSKGIQGALRSPNFIINDSFLIVKAKGKDSDIRVIIENFQLIQAPIYDGLEKRVNNEAWREYRFDLSMWQGQKAYVEVLSGYYENQQYQIPKDAWVEVEWVVLHNASLKQPVNLNNIGGNLNLPPKLNSAVTSFAAQKSTPSEISYLNKQFQNGKIKRTYPQLKKLLKTQKRLAAALYDSTFVIGITSGDKVESPVFERGSTKTLSKEKRPHGFLTVLKSPHGFSSNNGRMGLAEAIVDPKNPLTARVMVNRIWHHLFGRGIVETVDNFGLQGKLPSHPELLDYLAIEFVKSDWSIKNMIRAIVLSEAFQRTTLAGQKNLEEDPENVWLSHYPVQRLEAESIRDGILATSGNLKKIQFGEPIPVHLTEFMDGRGKPRSGPLDGKGRRSVYNSIRRNFLNPMLLVFDMPVPFSTFGKRNVSNVPAQSLTLMNDPFVQQQAECWAAELLCMEGVENRIEAIYWSAFSRAPNEKEMEEAEKFMENQAQEYHFNNNSWQNDHQIWSDFCHAIFNMKEFIFLI